MGHKIRIYTNGEFSVEAPKLTYYRKPVDVKFKGVIDVATNTVNQHDVLSELKDDVIEIICDEAAAIIAGDIESMNQYQRDVQNAGRNS